MARTILKSSDFLVDRPLPWNVYDSNGNLMYAKGSIVDEETKARLVQRGLQRDVVEEMGRLAQKVLCAELGKGALARKNESSSNDDRSQARQIALSESAVHPGDMLNIERKLDGSRCSARLIGYLKGKSVLLTVPADEQGLIFLKEGEAITVKVFSGKHILFFNATVLALPIKPYPHVHVSYPTSVSGFMVRSSERVLVRLICALEIGQEQLSGVIVDISLGGFAFVTRRADIKPTTEFVVNFRLQLADSTYVMRLGAVVRSVRGPHDEVLDGGTGYGAQFVELTAEDALIVSLFVSQKITESRSGGSVR